MPEPSLLWRSLRFTLKKPVRIGILTPLVLVGLEYLMRFVPAPVSPLGFGPLGFGFAIYVWCAFEFMRGEGTPSPQDPPKVLAVRGLYRFSRNPMFIGVLLMIVGLAVLFRSAVVLYYATVVFRGFHGAVVAKDEPMLREKYGISYEEYSSRVPRWVPLNIFGPLGRALTGYRRWPEKGAKDAAQSQEPDRQALRRDLQSLLQSFAPDRQRAVREEVRRLRSMSFADLQTRLMSEQFEQEFSREEQDLIRNFFLVAAATSME